MVQAQVFPKRGGYPRPRAGGGGGGAGIGGLVAARALRRAGLEVLVLEAHTYPGGLAGSFYHRGFRLDAGATLLSGFAPGAPWPWWRRPWGCASPWSPSPRASPSWRSTCPGERWCAPWGREAEREAQKDFFGPQVFPFWRWQAERADRLKALAPRLPWPPEGEELPGLLSLFPKLLPLLPDLFLKAVHRAPKDPLFLRFLDAQLLIASQTEARRTYALYAAMALDLPHMARPWSREGWAGWPRPWQRASRSATRPGRGGFS
jgi:phytoene dehydrogenase-like protein